MKHPPANIKSCGVTQSWASSYFSPVWRSNWHSQWSGDPSSAARSQPSQTGPSNLPAAPTDAPPPDRAERRCNYVLPHCPNRAELVIQREVQPYKRSGRPTLGCLLVSCRIVIGSGLGTAWPTIVGPNTRAKLLMSIRVSTLIATLQNHNIYLSCPFGVCVRCSAAFKIHLSEFSNRSDHRKVQNRSAAEGCAGTFLDSLLVIHLSLFTSEGEGPRKPVCLCGTVAGLRWFGTSVRCYCHHLKPLRRYKQKKSEVVWLLNESEWQIIPKTSFLHV